MRFAGRTDAMLTLGKHCTGLSRTAYKCDDWFVFAKRYPRSQNDIRIRKVCFDPGSGSKCGATFRAACPEQASTSERAPPRERDHSPEWR